MAGTRDRKNSETTLINAVHRLLLENGFQAVGINAIAEKAGLNKVLIYRYFGGLEGLLKTYAQRMDPFPAIVTRVEIAIRKNHLNAPEEVGKAILTSIMEELSRNRSFVELLKWELTEKNQLTQSIAESREINGTRLTRLFDRFMPPGHDIDVQAVTALLTGGLFYLIMRADTADTFNGIPISTLEGRHRLLDGALLMASALYPNK
jgi:AcrR family transcriptional regulator